MSRMPKLWRVLTGKNPDTAIEARAKALAAYEAAVLSKDTREIHRTWLQLKAATLGELRVGR